MFKALNLIEPVEELAVFPDALVMRDALTANAITRIPINTASFKKQFRFPYGVIYRPDLLNILKQACDRLPNINIIFNKRVVKTEQTPTCLIGVVIGTPHLSHYLRRISHVANSETRISTKS